jgi:DNA-binding MarR family transcriptional regulator
MVDAVMAKLGDKELRSVLVKNFKAVNQLKINHTDWLILRHLHHNPCATKQGLADTLGVSFHSITRSVVKLQRQGYVKPYDDGYMPGTRGRSVSQYVTTLPGDFTFLH